MEDSVTPFSAENAPHSRNLRLHRRMDGPGTFFVTKGLTPRVGLLCHRPVGKGSRNDALDLAPLAPGDVIVDALSFAVVEKRIMLAAFVVMPDHWHVLMGTQPGWLLPKTMRTLDSWIGKQTHGALSAANTCWQEGYHETRIRSSKQFDFVANYIEMNPVAKGLTSTRQYWRWSSANPECQGWLTRPWPYVFEKDQLG